MPRIKNYTRQVQPSQTVQANSSGQAFGANQSGAQYDAQALQQFQGVLTDAVQKRNRREDLINRTRATAQYDEEVRAEYLRTQTEGDLVDPNTARGFNEFVRGKANEYTEGFNGSADARAALENDLIGLQSRYVTQANSDAFEAQKGFLLDNAGQRLNSIAANVAQDPSSIATAFQSFDSEVLGEFGHGLDADDERALAKQGRGVIAETAINALIDSGNYEEADKLMGNLAYVENLPQKTQKSILMQINKGVGKKNEVLRGVETRRDVLNAIQEMEGVEIDASSRISFIADKDINLSPAEKARQVSKTLNTDISGMNPDAVFAAAYPKAWADSRVDHNKEFGPEGKATVKTLKNNIKPARNSANVMHVASNLLQTSINEFKTTGNKAAVQAAIVTFKKLFDPNSAVMEGEIRMQAEAEGWGGMFETFVTAGQAISTAQIEEMERLAGQVRTKYMGIMKNEVDSYLADADARGMRRIDIGFPREVYREYFGTDELGKGAKPINDYTNEELIQMYKSGGGGISE